MKIVISHAKNRLEGWDITIDATPDGTELVSQVSTEINNFPEAIDTLDPASNSYQRTYIQKGQYPGTNKVRVTVYNDAAVSTVADQIWDS